MGISPRTQQMQTASGAGVDQATAMFEHGFSEMAYNVLLSKFPDIVQDVVTFKILDTDLDKGMGVGAFVLMHGAQPLYIPVVMSDNNLKPIELVYHKGLDIFLPLSKAWLEEINKTALGALGAGVKTPQSLYTDVDIRNVVVPPITGRFSYAAWEPIILADVARVINKGTLEKIAAEPKAVLIEFLDKAPNFVKIAFARVLEKHPRILKHAAKVYGVKALTGCLQPRIEKTASTRNFVGGGLWIADKDTPPTEFKRIFGDRAPEAYAGVKVKGYYAKDTRSKHNRAVQEQPYQHWTEPNQPGVYILFNNQKEEKPALVVTNPTNLFEASQKYDNKPIAKPAGTGYHDYTGYERHRNIDRYLAVFANGDYLRSDKLVGESSVADELAGSTLHKHLFQESEGTPRAGLGFFVRQQGAHIQATAPLKIKSVTTDSEGARRITATTEMGWDEREIITQPKHPYGDIWMPKGANIIYLPPSYVWVPLKERLNEKSFFRSIHDLADCASSSLSAVGARKVDVKNASAGQFSIDGRQAIGRIDALKKLASACVLPVGVVETLLNKAAADRHISFWVASGEKLAKAQLLLEKRGANGDAKPKKEPPAEPAPDPAMEGDPSMDPAMAGDPSMMGAPPPPPPPSPSDLAAMEMQQQIEQEMQKLQEKQQMLMALTARTQEIATGAPVMPTVQSQAAGAPPPSQNLATGAPIAPPASGAPPPVAGSTPSADAAIAPPSTGGALPQDPSMMGGQDPSMMGGQDPSMMGGQDPSMMGGQDPSMMGGQDPSMMGQDPSAAGQGPPMAMMGEDGPNANALESEINPQFLDQAAQLESDDIFDAAAVSSLAQSPAIKELVAQYVPNLEKALDNLGRVILSLWMQEPDLKSDVGDAAFADLETNLRTTFKNLGDLVLKLSQSAHTIRGSLERANA